MAVTSTSRLISRSCSIMRRTLMSTSMPPLLPSPNSRRVISATVPCPFELPLDLAAPHGLPWQEHRLGAAVLAFPRLAALRFRLPLHPVVASGDDPHPHAPPPA